MKVPRLVLAFLLVSGTALAAKEQVPARTDSTVYAKPAESAAVVGNVKKGDTLTLMREQEDWALIMLPGGKPGWIPLRVARAKAKAPTTSIAAAEADTALALRECPVRKAVLIAPKQEASKVEAILEASKTVDVVTDRAGADVVITLSGSSGAMKWEIEHVAKKAVLAGGAAKTAEEAAALVLFQLERASHDTHHGAK